MQYSSSKEYSSSIKESPKWAGKDDKGYVYKKSSYQYSSSGNNGTSYTKNPVQNVDQLDALLEDLKNERKITKEKDMYPPTLSYRTLESSKNEPSGTITKTTKFVKTIERDGYPDKYSNTVFNNVTAEKSQKEKESLINENLYHEGTTVSDKLYERNLTTSSAEIVPQLHDVDLSNDILPIPGTKVTTTVRTYTYEIPAGSKNIPNRSILYNNVNYNTLDSRNSNSTIQQTDINVPQTVVYNTESYSTINKNETPILSNQSYEIRESRETNNLRQNYPSYSFAQQRTPESNSNTIIRTVNENVTVSDQNRNQNPHLNSLPYKGKGPLTPTTNRYYYKESSNVTNYVDKSPSNNIAPKMPVLKQNSTDYSPPFDNNNTSTTTYNYYSSNTTNHRGPDYPNTTTQLAQFPVDGVEFPESKPHLPQRVDDLMQSFPNTDVVDKSDISYRKREVETSVAKPNNEMIPTVNKAGMDVYYPPGHEMTLKREEYASGSAAGGRWAKGSGMYEYESGYKSKTKTKSGGAMVPVCLPLCCAMPCSIM
ncbi:RGS domain-containing serine/threonine-protein kinase A isoform X2 [Teleopsis dalmanni]|uniref:RGS domain-containing serine/threonine-protein kinase A isoform X2 n=1 Tax=Teleopsis dalmanni TaxID=139649 RepID=UPI0018CF760D|nr:RGS domain-containing serine/threonine-protein kinase A isoform X2 [Teleopsis dalmanni]